MYHSIENTAGQYCILIAEIKERIEIIDCFLSEEIFQNQAFSIEICYLQLRMICELIAIGCLLAHKDVITIERSKLEKKYQADFIIKEMEKLHPDFYPRPGQQINDSYGFRVENIEDGYLTKSDLTKLYQNAGDTLHYGSIKKLHGSTKKNRSFQEILEYRNKIVTLLSYHMITLKDSIYELWITAREKNSGQPCWNLMERQQFTQTQ